VEGCITAEIFGDGDFVSRILVSNKLKVYISAWYFPKRQLPMGIFPNGNFLNVQFPKATSQVLKVITNSGDISYGVFV